MLDDRRGELAAEQLKFLEVRVTLTRAQPETAVETVRVAAVLVEAVRQLM